MPPAAMARARWSTISPPTAASCTTRSGHACRPRSRSGNLLIIGYVYAMLLARATFLITPLVSPHPTLQAREGASAKTSHMPFVAFPQRERTRKEHRSQPLLTGLLGAFHYQYLGSLLAETSDGTSLLDKRPGGCRRLSPTGAPDVGGHAGTAGPPSAAAHLTRLGRHSVSPLCIVVPTALRSTSASCWFSSMRACSIATSLSLPVRRAHSWRSRAKIMRS